MDNKKLDYLTVFNTGFLDFAKNNVLNFRDVFDEDDTLTMVSLDKNSHDIIEDYIKSLSIKNIKLKLLDLKLPNFENFGSPNYKIILVYRYEIIIQKLLKSEQLYFYDSDIFFFKNPKHHIKDKLSRYDMIFQVDDPLTDGHKLYSNYVCTGNFALNNTEKTVRFMREVQQLVTPDCMDNDACCRYLNSKSTNLKTFKDINIDIMDPILFQNGFEAFRFDWHLYEDKVSIHANHMVGKEAKIEAMKKAGAWLV